MLAPVLVPVDETQRSALAHGYGLEALLAICAGEEAEALCGFVRRPGPRQALGPDDRLCHRCLDLLL